MQITDCGSALRELAYLVKHPASYLRRMESNLIMWHILVLAGVGVNGHFFKYYLFTFSSVILELLLREL